MATPPTDTPDSNAEASEILIATQVRAINENTDAIRGLVGGSSQSQADAVAALEQLKNTYAEVFKVGSQNLGEIIDVALGSIKEFTTFKLIDLAMQPLMTQLQAVEDTGKATVEIASVMQRLSGLNADALMRADYGIDTLAQKASKGAFEAVNKLADTQVKLLDGTTAYALQIASTEEMLSTFTEAALDDARLFSAASKGMSDDVLLSSTLATKRLGMTTSDLHEIFYRELAATGEMSGKFLNKIEADLLAAAKVTGDSIILMSKDLNKMMADFEHFGALAPEQMLSLSHTMHQLGINLRDVTSIADKFQSFDTAISTMSQLAATTGLTLDAVEMFELANLDPENLVVRLREEMDAQGLEFEQMNIIQKRQMARAFGIDPVVLQTLMNDNMKAVTGISDQITGEAMKIDDDRRKSLLTDMDRLEVTESLELAKRRSSAKAANIETAQSIERAYSAAAAASVRAMDAAGGLLDAGIKKFETFRKTLDEFSTGLEKANRTTNAQPATSTGQTNLTGNIQSAPMPKFEDTDRVMQMTADGTVKFASGDFFAASQNMENLKLQVDKALGGQPVAAPAPAPTAAQGSQTGVVADIASDVEKIAESSQKTADAASITASASVATAEATTSTAESVKKEENPATDMPGWMVADKLTKSFSDDAAATLRDTAMKVFAGTFVPPESKMTPPAQFETPDFLNSPGNVLSIPKFGGYSLGISEPSPEATVPEATASSPVAASRPASGTTSEASSSPTATNPAPAKQIAERKPVVANINHVLTVAPSADFPALLRQMFNFFVKDASSTGVENGVKIALTIEDQNSLSSQISFTEPST